MYLGVQEKCHLFYTMISLMYLSLFTQPIFISGNTNVNGQTIANIDYRHNSGINPSVAKNEIINDVANEQRKLKSKKYYSKSAKYYKSSKAKKAKKSKNKRITKSYAKDDKYSRPHYNRKSDKSFQRNDLNDYYNDVDGNFDGYYSEYPNEGGDDYYNNYYFGGYYYNTSPRPPADGYYYYGYDSQNLRTESDMDDYYYNGDDYYYNGDDYYYNGDDYYYSGDDYYYSGDDYYYGYDSPNANTDTDKSHDTKTDSSVDDYYYYGYYSHGTKTDAHAEDDHYYGYYSYSSMTDAHRDDDYYYGDDYYYNGDDYYYNYGDDYYYYGYGHNGVSSSGEDDKATSTDNYYYYTSTSSLDIGDDKVTSSSGDFDVYIVPSTDDNGQVEVVHESVMVSGKTDDDDKGDSKVGGDDTDENDGEDDSEAVDEEGDAQAKDEVNTDGLIVTNGKTPPSESYSYACSDFADDGTSVDSIAFFKYTVETKSEDYNIALPDLEKAILDEIYGEVLTCLFITLSKEGRRKLFADVYMVESSPPDKLSGEICTSETENNSCNTISGKMRFFVKEESDIEETRESIVAAVQSAMDKNKFNNGKVHDDLVKVKFYSGEQFVLSSAISQDLIGSGTIRGPYPGTFGIILIILAFIILASIGFVLGRRDSREKMVVSNDDDSTYIADLERSPRGMENNGDQSTICSDLGTQTDVSASSDSYVKTGVPQPFNSISVHKCTSATCDVCTTQESTKFIKINLNESRGKCLRVKEDSRTSRNTYLDTVYDDVLS